MTTAEGVAPVSAVAGETSESIRTWALVALALYLVNGVAFAGFSAVGGIWYTISDAVGLLLGISIMVLVVRFDDLFRAMGWNVVTLKYGTLLQAAFEEPGGPALRQWIDDCPNSLYSALVSLSLCCSRYRPLRVSPRLGRRLGPSERNSRAGNRVATICRARTRAVKREGRQSPTPPPVADPLHRRRFKLRT